MPLKKAFKNISVFILLNSLIAITSCSNESKLNEGYFYNCIADNRFPAFVATDKHSTKKLASLINEFGYDSLNNMLINKVNLSQDVFDRSMSLLVTSQTEYKLNVIDTVRVEEIKFVVFSGKAHIGTRMQNKFKFYVPEKYFHLDTLECN